MSRPLFTVLTPVYRPPLDFLEACIASVEQQTLDDWEMVLVDDGNPDELRAWLQERCAQDPRLRLEVMPRNGGIAAASQRGLDAARGEFVALLDHDDLYSPVALERMADMAMQRPEADYLYSDEDKVHESGDFFDPFFKPDWSPERFRHQMYTCHLSVLRTALAREVGGFRAGFDGSQDYDLVLRLTERARDIAHVPEILYHWRSHAGSTAQATDQKPAAQVAAVRAVQEHCDRTGIDAVVSSDIPGVLRVKRRVRGEPLVSLVIPTYGKSTQLRGERVLLVDHLLRSIERLTTYDNIEYVIVGDTRMSRRLVSALEAVCTHPVTYIDYEQPAAGFNFSHKVNVGAAAARGDYLLLLNDDMEVLTEDWVEELLAHAQEPGVAAVGGLFYFEDDTIQHAGVITTQGPRHLLYKHPRMQQVFGYHLGVARESTIVTGACLMLRRELYVRAGGLTETLPNNFNDVDLCLKLRSLGYRNIWTPYAELYHFESKSRLNTVQAFEHAQLASRWGSRLLSDPYYNPNLNAIRADWVPAPSWDRVARSWPAPLWSADDIDLDGYLECNDDVLAVLISDPGFDAVQHAQDFGLTERRLQLRRVPRPEVDHNARTQLRATLENYNEAGYLEANPDLAAADAADPEWDGWNHLRESGLAEGRYLYVSEAALDSFAGADREASRRRRLGHRRERASGASS